MTPKKTNFEDIPLPRSFGDEGSLSVICSASISWESCVLVVSLSIPSADSIDPSKPLKGSPKHQQSHAIRMEEQQGRMKLI